MSFFEGKRILVTGGSGMIGSQLLMLLLEGGATARTVLHSRSLPEIIPARRVETLKGDLTTDAGCSRAVKDVDFVFHVAAFVGGIGRNAARPSAMFTPNMLMNTNMLEAARKAGADRYLFTSSACVYPGECRLPIAETETFNGPPEPTNAPYGWVKRMGELQAQLYAKDYGMKVAVVRPFNAYGPYDNFDPETSHVIPALIRKAVERQDPFMVWGDGTPSRDFVYSRDIARGMMLAMEKYAVADPVNICTGVETKISELVSLIPKLCGHAPSRIEYERRSLKGQQRRVGDTAKAREKLGFVAEVGLGDGLARAIEFYKTHMPAGKKEA